MILKAFICIYIYISVYSLITISVGQKMSERTGQTFVHGKTN